MSVSATSAFELTRDQLIRRAFQLAGLIEVSQNPSADDISMAADFLAMELHALQAEGIVVTQVEQDLFALVASQPDYALPADAMDVAVGPDNVVGMIVPGGSGPGTPVMAMSRAEHLVLSNQSTEGLPTRVFIERGRVVVTLWFWMLPPTGSNYFFRYSKIAFPRDVGTGGVTLDLARRWQKAIAWSMAGQCALAKSMPIQRVKFIMDEAERFKSIARASDVEKMNVTFVPYGYERGY